MNTTTFLEKLNWENIKGFWPEPAILIQGGILLGMLLVAVLLTRLTKPLIKSLSEKSEEDSWSGKAWKHLERMLAPVYLILLCIVSLVIADPLKLGSESLIRPFASAAPLGQSTAWFPDSPKAGPGSAL